MRGLTCVFLAMVMVFAGSALAGAQQSQKPPPPPPQPLPDDPEPLAGDAIYAPLATGKGPESLKVKTDDYLVATFGPRALVSPMLSSGIAMAMPNYNYPNDWHQGCRDSRGSTAAASGPR